MPRGGSGRWSRPEVPDTEIRSQTGRFQSHAKPPITRATCVELHPPGLAPSVIAETVDLETPPPTRI
jgi:hypothetical protein